MTEQDNQHIKRSRIKFSLVVLLFVLPVLGAWILFFGLKPGEIWNTSNKGELITPAVPLKNVNLQLRDGSTYTLEQMETQWTLVYFASNPCVEACQKTIYYLRQIRTALNKDMQRVDRLLVLSGEMSVEMQSFLTAYPETKVVLNGDDVESFQAQFPELTAQNKGDFIYLVDPLGNVMMRYTTSQKPEDILKDLRKLLRISRIG